MTLEETVLNLRRDIEGLLPAGWQVWARLDLFDFRFMGFYRSFRKSVSSRDYRCDREMPTAQSVAEYMQVELEYMNRLKG